MKSKAVYILFAFLLSVSCDDKPDTCKEQSSRLAQFNFYTSRVAARDSILRNVDAAMVPSGFNKTVTGASRFTLPLLQTKDSAVYSLTINKTQKVKLTIYYTRKQIFENYKCGFRYDFIVDSVVSAPQFCDSIVIVQPYVTDVNQENCRFYFNRDTTKYR